MARRFGIASHAEARAYLAHPLLGARLARMHAPDARRRGQERARDPRLARRPQVPLVDDPVRRGRPTPTRSSSPRSTASAPAAAMRARWHCWRAPEAAPAYRPARRTAVYPRRSPARGAAAPSSKGNIMGLLDILKQYADPNSAQPDSVGGHFDEVAQQSNPSDLGGGVAAAFRSDATPPFGQMIGDLFGRSDPQQRAGILNQILQTVGPGVLASLGGGVLGRVLGGAGASGTPPTITPEQASQISPADAGAIAAHAEQHDSIDRRHGGPVLRPASDAREDARRLGAGDRPRPHAQPALNGTTGAPSAARRLRYRALSCAAALTCDRKRSCTRAARGACRCRATDRSGPRCGKRTATTTADERPRSRDCRCGRGH